MTFLCVYRTVMQTPMKVPYIINQIKQVFIFYVYARWQAAPAQHRFHIYVTCKLLRKREDLMYNGKYLYYHIENIL